MVRRLKPARHPAAPFRESQSGRRWRHASAARESRGQANFAEYVPLALLLLLIIELSRFSIYLVHALGIALITARLLHGYAMGFRAEFRFGRYWGAMMTFAILIVEAVLCLYQAYRGHLVWFST